MNIIPHPTPVTPANDTFHNVLRYITHIIEHPDINMIFKRIEHLRTHIRIRENINHFSWRYTNRKKYQIDVPPSEDLAVLPLFRSNHSVLLMVGEGIEGNSIIINRCDDVTSYHLLNMPGMGVCTIWYDGWRPNQDDQQLDLTDYDLLTHLYPQKDVQ